MSVFFALKNTPLTTFTPFSWERLRLFHYFFGWRVLIYVAIHLACHASLFTQLDEIKKTALKIDGIFGIARSVSILVVSMTFLRLGLLKDRIAYRLHVIVWVFTIGIICVHLRNSVTGIAMASLAGSFWLLDMVIRAVRFLYFKYHSKARIVPLANGATRLTLDRAPAGVARAMHCFVRIPLLSRYQLRAMTIVNVDPFEFVVPSYDKLTGSLHQYALAHSGELIPASLEGPYGVYPDPCLYHELLCIAGGSGAGFTIGVALQMLATMAGHYQKVRFIWMVPYQGMSQPLPAPAPMLCCHH
jgi:hypothetical protein